MALVANSVFFLFYSLFLNNKVFAHNHNNVYTPDHIEDKVYRTPRNTLGRSRFIEDINGPDYLWDGNGINHWRNDIDVVDAKMQGRLFTRRTNRATQAGYTNNADTCNLYNKNLAQVWTTLAKFIDTDQAMPDNMALHNVVLLVKAYLDHHSLLVKKNENIQQEEESANPSKNIPETIKEITEMLEKKTPNNDEETPAKIVASIINHIKTPKDKEYEKCFETSKEKLQLNVNREYQRYKEFSDCRRMNKLEKVSRQGIDKMSFSDAKRFLRQWEEDPATNCIIVARNTFLETLRAVIDGYIIDEQCLPQ